MYDGCTRRRLILLSFFPSFVPSCLSRSPLLVRVPRRPTSESAAEGNGRWAPSPVRNSDTSARCGRPGCPGPSPSPSLKLRTAREGEGEGEGHWACAQHRAESSLASERPYAPVGSSRPYARWLALSRSAPDSQIFQPCSLSRGIGGPKHRMPHPGDWWRRAGPRWTLCPSFEIPSRGRI